MIMTTTTTLMKKAWRAAIRIASKRGMSLDLTGTDEDIMLINRQVLDDMLVEAYMKGREDAIKEF